METIEQHCERVLSKIPSTPPTLTNQEDSERKIKRETLRSEWDAPLKHVKNRSKIDYQTSWGEKLLSIERRFNQGFLIALVGANGPGKTQLGVELMFKMTEQLKRALYCTATEFFMDVKATYHSQSPHSERSVIEQYSKPYLLVIDELGKCGQTEWEDRLLFEMIDRRYRNMKDTLLISNEEKPKFLESIGASLRSRMQETGGIIECNWPSFRTNK